MTIIFFHIGSLLLLLLFFFGRLYQYVFDWNLFLLSFLQTLEELSDSVAKETRRASNSSDLPRIVLAPRRSARLAAAATAASRGSPAAPRGPKLSAPLPEMLGNMASTFTLNLLSVGIIYTYISVVFLP